MCRPPPFLHDGVVTNPSPSQQLAQLWRTRPHRLPDRGPIAGVAAGVGPRYHVGPTRVGIAVGVATIFGGSGLFLYLFAWLTLPRAGSGISMADMLLGRGRSGDSQTAAVLVAGATLLSLIGGTPIGLGLIGAGPLSLIAMGAAWWLLYKRTPNPPAEYPLPAGAMGVAGIPTGPGAGFGRTDSLWDTGSTWNAYTVLPDHYEPEPTRPVPNGAAPGMPAAPAPGTPAPGVGSASGGPSLSKDTAAQYAPQGAGRGKVAGATAERARAPPPLTRGGAAPGTPGRPPSWDPLGVAPFAWDLPDPNAPAEPAPVGRRRSHYTSKVLGAAIVITAATAGVGLATGGSWVTLAHLSAVALLVIGLGLLFGGLRRRGYGLLFFAAPLSAVMITASLVPGDIFDLDAETVVSGQTAIMRPRSVEDLSASYANGFGEFTLDLSDITLDADRTIDVTTHFGETTVTVPADMRVDVTCDAKMAEALCDIPAAGNADDPVLTLDMSARFADVQVVRNG